MTKKEAERFYRAHILPEIRQRYERDGRRDEPARAEAWNAYTDDLCKSGEITPEQYRRWTTPD